VKFVFVIIAVAVIVSLRVWRFTQRRRRRAAIEPCPSSTATCARRAQRNPPPSGAAHRASKASKRHSATSAWSRGARSESGSGGRIFRFGTLVVLVAVAAVIVIPTLHHGNGGQSAQTIGVVGGLSPAATELVRAAGSQSEDAIQFVTEPSLAAAERALRSNKVDFAIVNADRVVLSLPASSSNSPADSTLVGYVADYLGVLRADRAAGLTTAQAAEIIGSKPVPVQTLERGSKSATNRCRCSAL